MTTPSSPTSLGDLLVRVRFDRIRESCDRITIERRDGSSTTWTCPTYGGTIPHDLVHLVVETVFDLDGGLWGTLASGSDMAGVRARAGTPEGAELLTAEALAIVNWYDAALDGAQRCEAVLEACADLRAAPPPTLSPARAERATALLKPLKARCRALAERRAEAVEIVGGIEVHVSVSAAT